MRRLTRLAGISLIAAVSWPGLAAQETAAVFQGPTAEHFLLEGRVGRVTSIGEGVTNPLRVMLSLDGTTRASVFKAIDVDKPGATWMPNGTLEVGFQDSWRTEVAAYEIDKLVGLGMVPATVERVIQSKQGSLQWWVDIMMPEADRVKQGLRPPDVVSWNRQMLKMRLFDELIMNVDRHLNNILVTESYDLRLIDHSRAFRATEELRTPERLTLFSRSLLDGIGRLDEATLTERVGKYLRDGQIQTLLVRRDAILGIARQRVAEFGEDSIIYP